MKKQSNKKNGSSEDGRIPKNILNMLHEFTIGGFVVFYFNAKTGRPEEELNFDSPAHALAAQKHIDTWLQTIDQVNLENSVNNIQENLRRRHEEQEEDDGEDGEENNK